MVLVMRKTAVLLVLLPSALRHKELLKLMTGFLSVNEVLMRVGLGRGCNHRRHGNPGVKGATLAATAVH
jgi:hypothetical protein